MKTTRSQMYFRLASLVETGISTSKAFKIVSPGSSKDSKAFYEASQILEQQGDLQKALVSTGKFSSLEIALSVTGEKCGTLPDIWRYLSRYHEERSKAKKKWISKMYYPTFLIHAGIVAANIPVIVFGGMSAFLAAVFWALFSMYAAIFLPIITLYILRSNENTRIYLDQLATYIPFINKLLIYHYTSYAFTIIHGMYYSGINIKSAFRQAQHSISFHPLQESLGRISEKIEGGLSLENAMKNEDIFPSIVYETIVIGETSGKLDTTLKKLCEITDEQSFALFEFLLRFTIAAVVTIVMTWLVIQILQMFAGYMSTVGSIR